MKKFYGYITISLFAALGASVSLIATPFFLGKAIDAMGHNMDLVLENLGISLAIYAFYSLMSFLVQITSSHAGILYTQILKDQLLSRIEKVSLSYLDTSSHGYILSVFTNDTQLFQEGLVQLITQGFQGVFTVIIAAVFMFQIDVSLTLIVFISIPIVMLNSYFVNIRASKLFTVQQENNAVLNDTLTQVLENHELIQTNNLEGVAQDWVNRDNDALNKIAEKAQFMGALINPTTRLVNNISYMMIGLLGSFVVVDKGISIGVLTSFISYSVMFSKPMNEMSAVFGDISLGKVAFDRIRKQLKMPLQIDTDHHVGLKGETITMKGVHFSYNNSIPAITDLDLNIKPLSKVAIVGPTGSGKSTLINLLLRFYDINQGEFRVDGMNVSSMSSQSVREVMGVVLQEPWLFKGSILENLKFGNADASYEQVEFMAQQVGAADFINSLHDGYDSIIGEINLSQGQKQMLTIVRALLSDAPVLLLDEATSNIDIVSEKIIQQTLQDMMETHTSFFVAHRLQTVVDSDLILVMKEGVLVEQGTHESLMQADGFYAQLYQAQF